MVVKNHMAILRNLRNILEAGVSEHHIEKIRRCFSDGSWRNAKALPFRFISAARYAPQLEPEIEEAMLKNLADHKKMPGKTALLLDVSGSMGVRVSDKSEITRLDAACGVAMLLREICEQIDIFTFSNDFIRVPARHGFALRDAVLRSQPQGGTWLGAAVRAIYSSEAIPLPNHQWNTVKKFHGAGLTPDRLIVITDEQSHDSVPDPIMNKGYMINVASYQNGVGYGPWLHIDGWSEAVVKYIQEMEDFES